MAESPTSSSFFIGRADSPLVIEFNEGNEVRFRLTGSDTGGVFELFDRVAPGGKMLADMHLHLDVTESFRVLEGELEFSLGSEIRVLVEGDCLTVPPGTPHAMNNRSERPVKLQIMFTPSRNHERYFALFKEGCFGPKGRDPKLTDRLRREFGGFSCDCEGNPIYGLPLDA